MLSLEQRTRIIHALCEGNSVRATCRLTGAAKGTVLRLLASVATACQGFHDQAVCGITAKQVQCDEIWSFCYGKARNLSPALAGKGFGDVWTWVGLDADTKLAISWLVGSQTRESAHSFMSDLASRLANRVQLTTDGNNLYLPAVERAFGWDGVDYARLIKLYSGAGTARYSPPTCVGTRKSRVMGKPVRQAVSTSYVERQNLTMRMQMRRYTRLTNAFSKKVENHCHATALYFTHYNWCRPHQTLTKQARGIRRTPAMAAGLTNRVWAVRDLVMLLLGEQTRASKAS